MAVLKTGTTIGGNIAWHIGNFIMSITSIASGEILKWNGSAWINNTLAEAEIPRMTVSSSTPSGPAAGDLWLDTT